MVEHGIVILDFGSQYTQLIARRCRELGVFSELMPFDTALEEIKKRQIPNVHFERRAYIAEGMELMLFIHQGKNRPTREVGADIVAGAIPVFDWSYRNGRPGLSEAIFV